MKKHIRIISIINSSSTLRPYFRDPASSFDFLYRLTNNASRPRQRFLEFIFDYVYSLLNIYVAKWRRWRKLSWPLLAHLMLPIVWGKRFANSNHDHCSWDRIVRFPLHNSHTTSNDKSAWLLARAGYHVFTRLGTSTPLPRSSLTCLSSRCIVLIFWGRRLVVNAVRISKNLCK